MQLLWPEIVAEVRGLSVAATAAGLALGLLLWLFGWLGHRFWIVLAATAAAGIAGMYLHPIFGAKSLLVALLLAVAGGMLALSLVRVVAFAAGGLAVWVAARAVAPAWDEPLVCFLAGGLAGMLLFRLWTMALTSFLGALLMGYSGLALAERFGKMDAVLAAESRALLINWIVLGAALVGLGLQLLLDRWRSRRRRESVRYMVEPPPEVDFRPAWKMGRRTYRRAG